MPLVIGFGILYAAIMAVGIAILVGWLLYAFWEYRWAQITAQVIIFLVGVFIVLFILEV